MFHTHSKHGLKLAVGFLKGSTLIFPSSAWITVWGHSNDKTENILGGIIEQLQLSLWKLTLLPKIVDNYSLEKSVL